MTEAITAHITARIAHIRHVYGDADQDATLLEALLKERERKAAKPADVINAAIDRAAEQTRQAYIKRGMFAREAIEHLVRLLCVEIAASQPAPIDEARKQGAQLLRDMLYMENGAHIGMDHPSVHRLWYAVAGKTGYSAVTAFLDQLRGQPAPALDVTGAAPDAHQTDLTTAGAQQGQAVEQVTFQDRVYPWLMACFGPEISADHLERGDRLLEEVLELLQSGDYPKERVAILTEYVWSRPAGEPDQEVGGVMLTLAAYCLAHFLNMHNAGERELARVWTKVEKIRAKQAAKPRGSALPQDWPTAHPLTAQDAARVPEIAALIEAATAAKQHIRGALGFTLNAALRAIAEGE